MQYITQSSRQYFNEKIYLLFQIVKEQPIAAYRYAASSLLIFFAPLAPRALRLESSLSGGANRDRTDDLLLAKQALSQLSYGPSRVMPVIGGSGWIRTIDPRLIKTVL